MKPSIKIIIFLLVVSALSSLLYAFGFRERETVDAKLSPRAMRIEEYLADHGKATAIEITTKTFSIVEYLNSENSNIRNHDSFPYVRGGVIAFEGKNIVWESSEFIWRVSDLRLQDINSDGINEILFEDVGGGNRPSCAFYMYQWRDSAFHLISPYEDSTTSKGTYRGTKIGSCGPSIRDGFLEDIDDDGTEELIQATYDNKKLTYKFNGTEYKLWKEEPGTPYNPKDWEPNNG